MMAPIGVPGTTKVINIVYEPTPRVRLRAGYMSETYEALGRVVETLSRAGKDNDAVESVAWDQFKDSAQKLTGDMRRVRSHYANAVEEFGQFVSESTRLHSEVADLVVSHNQLMDQLVQLRGQHAQAIATSVPSASSVLAALSADPAHGQTELQEQIEASGRRATELAEQIKTVMLEITTLWESIDTAERRQQSLATAAAEALRGARDVSGLNDGFWGNLGAFFSGLLDIIISVLKIIVMVLLVVLTLVTLILTPFIGPGPAAGLLLLTIFVAGVLFVAQVVRAALEGLDFGAFMAAIGAAALHFGAVVLGAFLGGVAGAFVKGLLGSLGPLVAGAVAAAVKAGVQQGITALVDDTLVDGLLELGGPEARELYDELVNSPAGQFLEVQATGFGAGFTEASGAHGLAEQAGSALGDAASPLMDAVGAAAADIADLANDLAEGIDAVFGAGSADLLRDSGIDIGGDILTGSDVGDAVVGGLNSAATDWLEQRVDNFLAAAEELLGGDLTVAFEEAGLEPLGNVLEHAGFGDLLDYGEALGAGRDPLSLFADAAGVGDLDVADWMASSGRGEVVAAISQGRVPVSWIGASGD